MAVIQPHDKFRGMRLPQPLVIALEALPERSRLQAWWRALEDKADHTFFTSWSWIGPWLSVLPAHLQTNLIIARQDGDIVGLGIVVKGHAHLMRTLPVACWRLHATGVRDIDDLTIEYNGFLVDKKWAHDVEPAMLNHLLRQTGVKRLEVSMAADRFAHLAQPAPAGIIVRSDFKKSYLVDLDMVRDATGGFLSTLSANTRSQIKRSLSAYRAELGPVQLECAQDAAQARTFLTALKALHEQTWAERGKESGFATSDLAKRFHMGVIDQAFDKGEVQLMRISAGASTLGYLYSFVHRGRVIFYQSGLRYGLLSKHDRPGLVCHMLAIEHHVQTGQHWYDFAAGDYRYKASLAKHHEVQGSHVFQGDGLLPRLDHTVRSWVHRMRKPRINGHAVIVAALACLLAGLGNADWLLAIQA